MWEGQQPSSDTEAIATFEDLYERHVELEDGTPPTERITEYVNALLTRFPDLTELDDDAVDESPWADGPLIGNAVGPFFYFSMVANEAAESAWSHAVSTAASMNLVCFDPQSDALAT